MIGRAFRYIHIMAPKRAKTCTAPTASAAANAAAAAPAAAAPAATTTPHPPAPPSGKHIVTLPAKAKCDVSALKVGDYLSRVNYIKVVSVDGDMCRVRDGTGFEWSIGKSILENQAYTSDQYTHIEKVNRTEMARLLEQDVRDQVRQEGSTHLQVWGLCPLAHPPPAGVLMLLQQVAERR